MLKITIQIIMLGLLFLGVGASVAAPPDKDQAAPEPAKMCEETVSGFYSPFTPLRKFRLAAAYFVDPSLPERSEIVNAFPLGSSVDAKKTHEVWAALQSGKAKFLLPSAKVADRLVAMSLADIKSLGSCFKAADKAATKGEIGLGRSVYFRHLDFVKADSFGAWISTLSPEDLKNIRIGVRTEGPIGIASSERFVSWAPGEPAKIVLDRLIDR